MNSWRNWITAPIDIYQRWKQSKQGNPLAGYPGFSCQLTEDDETKISNTTQHSNTGDLDSEQFRATYHQTRDE